MNLVYVCCKSVQIPNNVILLFIINQTRYRFVAVERYEEKKDFYVGEKRQIYDGNRKRLPWIQSRDPTLKMDTKDHQADTLLSGCLSYAHKR